MTDHVDHGTWARTPETKRKSAHAQVIEAAREAARAHFMNSRLVGAWGPKPDLASWPKPYAEAFREELARLAAGAGSAEGGPS